MATYAIGDVQGCFKKLMELLEKLRFNDRTDTLWFTGDLVNRGPQSLDVLRFIRSLGDKQMTVLGNHDLHLIAQAYGGKRLKHDTLEEVLNSSERDELIHWLRHRPLLHHDPELGYVMTHAGLAPSWTLAQAKALAKEVESVLQNDNPQPFLEEMYGNSPDKWEDQLTGMARLRCIINFMTRLRYCHLDGRMDFAYKGALKDKPADLHPWFLLADRKNKELPLVFGHWAALGGQANVSNIYPLDTGCVWGVALTAMRLEDKIRFSIPC